jgi:hypothetical protein
MRRPAHQRTFMAPRQSLKLANRWMGREVLATRGMLSFAPLTLALRRARELSATLLPLRLSGGADSVEVVVAPRLAFNLHLCHAVKAASDPRTAASYRGDPSERHSTDLDPAPENLRNRWGREPGHQERRPVLPVQALRRGHRLFPLKRQIRQLSRLRPSRGVTRLLSGTRPWDSGTRTVDRHAVVPKRLWHEETRVRFRISSLASRQPPTTDGTSPPRLRSADVPGSIASESRLFIRRFQSFDAGSRYEAAALTSRRTAFATTRPMLTYKGSGRGIPPSHIASLGNSFSFQGYRESRQLQPTGLGAVGRDELNSLKDRLTAPSMFGPRPLFAFPHARVSSDSGTAGQVRAERSAKPAHIVHRQERTAAVQAPLAQTPSPVIAPPAPQVVDIGRLTDEVWRQLDKRIRIERQRRGRL